MKTYRFYVSLCNGWCGGVIEEKADNEDEACDKAIDDVGNRLAKAFPELSIDYNVELIDGDEDEVEDDE